MASEPLPTSSHILIAHDDEAFLERWKKIFTTLTNNFEISTAKSPNEALEELAVGSYRLLVTEYCRTSCEGKKIVDGLEDFKPEDRPQSVLAIADLIDRGFESVELPDLNYIGRTFRDEEAKQVLKALLSIAETNPAKSLEAGFIFPFVDGAKEVLKTMAQMDCQKESVQFKRNEDIKDISALANVISPHFYGSMAISFEKSCFLKIVSNMFGEEYKEITADIQDAVAELCNQIFGYAKTKLNEMGHEIQPAIPTVIIGTQVPHSVQGQPLSVVFTTASGRFAIETMIR